MSNAFLSKYNQKEKNDLMELTSFIESNNKKIRQNIKSLTFDFDASLFLIMKDYNNFNLVPVSFWTSKTTLDIEKDLILTFIKSPGLQTFESTITGVIYLVLPKYLS